tara:strand:+ start:247 stop:1008 length:762 start_codon:yes stop_codon:yes gene_type:complete
VDDGSTDGTGEWLRELEHTARFSMQHIYQDNGGKHRAINSALKVTTSDWILVLDSDDWLLPGALKKILYQIRSSCLDTRAIIAPLCFGRSLTQFTATPTNLVPYSFWAESQEVGDTSILTRTQVLRDYPFPEFKGEMFIAESSVYASAFLSGGIKLTNCKVVGAEYQPGGLSDRSLEIRTNSPLGAIETYRRRIKAHEGLRYRWRAKINMYRFYWHARDKYGTVDRQAEFWAFIWIAFSWIAYLWDLRKMRSR